ncbi:antibiotic biosynthesis monooxygenase family protein [Actinokineospora cianjurensis]|uniref:Heme-degrading monooxygenase HmoA n=1 Tax=Actinokineospora cianjurensis TaxID=585224 RepID=A0A421AUP3_9PSEU|nr:antibiotic biosynthesis monooxygenase [Actinokineospora cianjurensis]RLK53815.1 heme-degrading monooxygenase HmoA [Actinokineospora cianjurensis]
MELSSTPEPPYYAVIFTSVLSPDDEGYHEAADRMLELVAATPGFIGVDSARGADRLGITVSYFEDEAAIARWREQPEHAATRARGRERWYDAFEVRVARVERAYRSR